MVMKSSYLRGLNLASFFVASKITVFMTFMAYVLLGNVISASRVFVAVSLYGAVRLTVTLFFPAAVERVSEAVVSIRRIKVWLWISSLILTLFYHHQKMQLCFSFAEFEIFTEITSLETECVPV